MGESSAPAKLKEWIQAAHALLTVVLFVAVMFGGDSTKLVDGLKKADAVLNSLGEVKADVEAVKAEVVTVKADVGAVKATSAQNHVLLKSLPKQ